MVERPSHSAQRSRRVVAWGVLIAVTVAAVLAARAVRLPSPEILASMVVGATMALTGRAPRTVSAPVSVAAQAVMGVAMGGLVTRDELHALSRDWAAVLVVILITLALSLGSGFLLALHPAVDRVTGVLSMAAGGASGLVAVAGDLGGDERVVGTLQYTRVLIITATTPPIAAWLFHAVPGAVPTTAAGSWEGVLVSVGCGVGGLALARLTRMPAGDLLVPMILTGVLGVGGWLPMDPLPGLLVAAAYVVIGWNATLGFTRTALRNVGRLLPWSMVLLVVLLVVTALAGVWLARVTGQPDLDGYLATTPGGMMAILAVAAGADSNVTFITGVQAVRLFLMLALTPLLTRWLSHREAR